MTPTDALFLTPSWTKEDISYVRDMCNELKVPPEEFYAIPVIESWLNPAWSVPRDDGKTNNFVAVGLVQFTRIVAVEYKWIKTTEADPKGYADWKVWSNAMHKMPVKDQLPYIKEFLTPFAKKHDISKAYRMYQIFAASSTMDSAKELSDVIYPEGSAGYLGNQGLDIDKTDGGITLNDLKLATDDAKSREIYKAIVIRHRALGF